MVSDIVGKFARVESDAYEEYGLVRDSIVFIAGSGFSPVDDDDNYKLLFAVVKIGEDGLPASKKGITIARKSLGVLSDESTVDMKKKLDNALAIKEAEAPSV